MTGLDMRRALAVMTVLLVACGPSFDEDGNALVREWADEAARGISAAALAADEASRLAAADRIDEANAYWDRGDWPDDVEGWQINMTQGDRTWQVDGSDLWPAIRDLEDASDWLAEQLRGDDDQELEWALDDAQDAQDRVADVLTGR